MFNIIPYLDIKFEYKGYQPKARDCWGLCMLIAKKRNILLPNINYKNYHLRQIHTLIEEKKEQDFKKVKPDIDTIAAFKIHNKICHVGYMISEKEFIHIREEIGVTVNKIDDPKWKTFFEGCYKYIGDNNASN